ncbi:hypothetical protein CVU37_05925 [candidate division BRC1 bacterium HGW-BRC1-1]|jgi:hypothetical protein|nr:MAG: hypothetical protein CVU37_05925 [candidate division BRC1 bacterium HGW-BRC1-1]
MKLPVIAFLCAAIALAQSTTHACGPWYPTSYLVDGREDRVALMPEGRFDVEAARIIGVRVPPGGVASEPSGWDQTLDQDLQDLSEALGTTATAELMEQYAAMRRKMKESTTKPESESFFPDRLITKAVTPEFDITLYDDLLAQLPREFELYARGAAAYHDGNTTSAVGNWEALLDLPAEQRHFRSTWAAFMIGKAYLASDPDRAVSWLEKSRALRDDGFADTLDLSSSSLGWQAQAEKKQSAFVEALTHYTQIAQQKAGDEKDLVSLRWTCHVAFQNLDSADALKPLAQDPLTRQLMTAWIVCCATGSYPVEWAPLPRWEETVRAASDDIDTTTADYLAWGTYRQGRFDDAKKWLAATDDRGTIGKWVRTKVLLRDGRVDDALTLLQEIVPLLPTDERWESVDDSDSVDEVIPSTTARAEEGVLLLGRQDFLGAFDSFVHARYWDDAAYMAERVLTTKELEGYLKAHAGEDYLSSPTEALFLPTNENFESRLKYLLARRFARAQQWDKAMEYMPEKYRPTLEDYVSSLKAGKAARASKRDRAEALYLAGMIAREYGMELMGTENEPDWTQYDGSLARDDWASKSRFEDKVKDWKARAGDYRPVTGSPLPEASIKALSGSADERKRVAQAAVKPEKRFHYRYTASDLMWEAAKLSPDNTPLTASALYLGGNWHKKTDDAYADRFYQALVRRCNKLPIGKVADTDRWFPQEHPPMPGITYREPKQ